MTEVTKDDDCDREVVVRNERRVQQKLVVVTREYSHKHGIATDYEV